MRLPARPGGPAIDRLRGIGPPRRALLDAAGGLRRRADRRARRRTDRPGPHPNTPARAGAWPPPRQPSLRGGQRDGPVLLLRRPALLVRRSDQRPEADLAAVEKGPLSGELSD